jgi:hypothetical protein
MDKDVRKLLKEAEKQGFTWALTTKGHIQVRGPDGRLCTTLSGTPGTRRELMLAKHYMRRDGYDEGK